MTPLWRLVRKLFGKPKGRHAVGLDPSPPVRAEPEPSPPVEPAPEPRPMPVAEPEPLVAPTPEPVVVPVAEPEPLVAPTPEPVFVPAPVATAVPTAAPEPVPVTEPPPVAAHVAPVIDLGPVRLIFSDGTIAPLPAGSPEDRRARYLARRVLEATDRR